MYFGMPPQEVHEKLLVMFALIDIKDDRFEVESTTGMDSERLFLLIENIWQWIVDNGIPLEHYTNISEQTKIKIIER
jgi:phage terminase large subunit GpA-like protein